MSEPRWGELPLLSADEERRLVREYRRTHDRKLEDRLVRSQMRLVAKQAREHGSRHDEISELIQEGALGLVLAVRRFDPDRGVRLSTYASWWIRAYQLRWLVSNHRLVRIGTTAAQRHIFHRARGVRARLASAGLEASPAELARALGENPDTVRETLQRLDGPELSLDAPGPGVRDETGLDRLRDPGPLPDERVADAELAGLVMREAGAFSSGLTARDRLLFSARWLDPEPLTLQKLGDRLGVSRERTRQLEQRLLRRLRERLPGDLAAAA